MTFFAEDTKAVKISLLSAQFSHNKFVRYENLGNGESIALHCLPTVAVGLLMLTSNFLRISKGAGAHKNENAQAQFCFQEKRFIFSEACRAVRVRIKLRWNVRSLAYLTVGKTSKMDHSKLT